MIVLDTHAWLWWTAGDSRLSTTAAAVIQRENEVGISTISAWEAATLVRLGRLRLEPDVHTWIRQALALEGVQSLPPTAEIAAEAGSLGFTFSGDPADRIVYATAVATGSRLVTADRRIRDHDPAGTIW